MHAPCHARSYTQSNTIIEERSATTKSGPGPPSSTTPSSVVQTLEVGNCETACSASKSVFFFAVDTKLRYIAVIHLEKLRRVYASYLQLYSRFIPTLPMPRSPQMKSNPVAALNANRYQKAALKPSISATGLFLS